MGRKSKSVFYGLFAKLEQKKAFGRSRHDDKKAGVAQNYIYSFNTYGKYKQVAHEFSNWCESNGVTKFSQVEQNHVKNYLLERQDRGLSAFTVQTDMSALNKLLDLKLTKKEVGLNPARSRDINKGREFREFHRHASEETFKEQILVARATGLRRDSMLRIKKEDFYQVAPGEPYSAVRLLEKGGKLRFAVIRPDLADELTDVLNQLPDYGELFQSYSTAINNHSFRREYAQFLYEQYLKDENRGDRKDYRGYDKEALLYVSKNLGHNRPSVVVYHYMK